MIQFFWLILQKDQSLEVQHTIDRTFFFFIEKNIHKIVYPHQIDVQN